jgi:hypothetical protein
MSYTDEGKAKKEKKRKRNFFKNGARKLLESADLLFSCL